MEFKLTLSTDEDSRMFDKALARFLRRVENRISDHDEISITSEMRGPAQVKKFRANAAWLGAVWMRCLERSGLSLVQGGAS